MSWGCVMTQLGLPQQILSSKNSERLFSHHHRRAQAGSGEVHILGLQSSFLMCMDRISCLGCLGLSSREDTVFMGPEFYSDNFIGLNYFCISKYSHTGLRVSMYEFFFEEANL